TFRLVNTYGIDGTQRAEAALPESSLALELSLGLDGEASPGDRLEAALGDWLACQLTDSIGILFNTLESLFDFVDGVLVGGKQTQGEVTVEVIGAGIGHMEAVTGHLLSRLFGQTIHLPDELLPQLEEPLVKL